MPKHTLDYQLAFEALPGNFVLLAPDSPHYTILGISEEMLSQSGRQRQDVAGKSVFEVFAPNPATPSATGPESLRSFLEQALATRQPNQMPLVRYDVSDGKGEFQVRYWLARNKPVLSPDGEVLFLLHSTENVTPAVLTQQKMQESEEQFRAMVDQAPVAIALTRGPDLTFESINAFMLPIIGRKHPGEVIGKPLIEVLPELQDQPVLDLIRQVYRTGEPYQGLEVPATLQVGGQLREGYYNISYTPLRENGQITGVIHLAVEVTGQVLARKQIEQSKKGAQALAQELAASNEEIRAASEELVQTNHQLAASEEELRQTLEHTVNLNERLSQQERFLSSILDQSPFATWIADRTGTATYINEASRKLFGLEDVNQSLRKYNILQDNTLVNQPFFKDIKAVFTEGNMAQIELEYDVSNVTSVTVPTGRRIQIVLTLFPIKDSQGTLTNVVVQAEDVTQRRQSEQELAYQHLLTKTITDNATSCLLLMDKRGYCTFMNPAGEKMFGYSQEEILAKPLHYLIHHHRPDGSYYPMEECPIDRALPENFDIRAHQDLFFRKDGSCLPVSCAASPIFENGVPVSTVIEVRDVTEEQKAREQLEEVNQVLLRKNEELKRINVDLDNFVYTASHDLKSPIANLEGLQWQLSKRLKGKVSAMEQEMMEMMQEALTKLNRTIKDLSEIAKIQKEAGEQELLSFREVLEDVTTDITPLIRETAAHLEIDLAAEHIHYPRKHLRSILYNLLSNALKYHSPDRTPRILIQTRQEQGQVVLSVEDNGLGLDKEQQAKLFLMFKRLHTHVEGTGVGLYMVKRIVENNGGRIAVESQPEKGTTFRVYFASAIELLEDTIKSDL